MGTCINCKHFKPSRLGAQAGGYCQRNPPQLGLFGLGQRNPYVKPNGWCSHWESKYGESTPFKKIEEPKLLNKTDETDPLKILAIRYAKGEITKKEFEQTKKDILELSKGKPIEKTIKPKKTQTIKPKKSVSISSGEKTDKAKRVTDKVQKQLLKKDNVIHKLIDKIHQGNYKERIDSIKTLGALGDKKAVEPLLEIINEKPKDESTVPLILKALVEIGDSNAIERLTEIKKNTSKYLDKQFSEVIHLLSSAEKPKNTKKETKKPMEKKTEKTYKISCPQCNSKIEVGKSVKKLKCPECGFKLEFT